RMFKGPIATTLENERVAFLPVDPVVPGKNMYPRDATRAELDAWMAANTDAENLLAARTRVRHATAENARHDLATLEKYPVLDTLHPELRARLETIAAKPERNGFYAVPYA